MILRAVVLLCCACLFSLLTSCQRLPNQRGLLSLEAVPYPDAIPTDYGDLIGVAGSDDRGWTQVWFQKPDRSIVVVLVNPAQGKIADRMITIPRR